MCTIYSRQSPSSRHSLPYLNLTSHSQPIDCHSLQLGCIDVQLSTDAIQIRAPYKFQFYFTYFTYLTNVTCLVVFIDSEPTVAAHNPTSSNWSIGQCFYQLRQLRTIRRVLSVEAAQTFLHAFVISRVYHWNSIFGFTSAVRPSSFTVHYKNAAACLIVKRRKFDRIIDSLRDELNWLPV